MYSRRLGCEMKTTFNFLDAQGEEEEEEGIKRKGREEKKG